MKLTSKARKALPASDFAGPDRSFPINDINHGRAALSMAGPDDNEVRAKVQRKFPSIKARKPKGMRSR